MSAPDTDQALASEYDERLSLLSRRAQKRAVAQLELRGEENVLDVACGTGLNFAAIQDRIGPYGRLVGIDASAEMLDEARRRVAAHHWQNVELIHADVVSSGLGERFDAALLSFTHDLLRTPQAVDAVVDAVEPRGRVAATGVQYPPRALRFLRPLVRRAARDYVTTFEGLERPWSHLEERLADQRAEALLFGTLFVISGRPKGATDG